MSCIHSAWEEDACADYQLFLPPTPQAIGATQSRLGAGTRLATEYKSNNTQVAALLLGQIGRFQAQDNRSQANFGR